MAGSRPGANIASAWISMMKTGGKGFTQNAKSVQYATMKTAETLRELGYIVYGEPNVCTIGFCHR